MPFSPYPRALTSLAVTGIVLTGCTSRIVAVRVSTPGVESAVVTNVNGKSTAIEIPGLAHLETKDPRESEPRGNAKVYFGGLSLEIETKDGVIARAYVSTRNTAKFGDFHSITKVESLRGPGEWRSSNRSLTWDLRASSKGRFVYVLGCGPNYRIDGELERPSTLPNHLTKSPEFDGGLHEVRARTCTVTLGGTKIDCLLPEGSMLRVERLKARLPIIEFRGVLAKAQVSGTEGKRSIRPKRLASPTAWWARYSLLSGRKLSILDAAGTPFIHITQKPAPEPQPAIRLKLILLTAHDDKKL